MFQLVAMLFAITNGITADQPSSIIPNKRVFTTEQICLDFMGADAGKASMERFNRIVGDHKDQVAVKFACVEVEDKSSDNDKI